MRKPLFPLLPLIILLLFSGVALAQTKSDGVKDNIKKMENELRQGSLKGDSSAAEKYLADDFQSVSGATGKMSSKAEIIARLKSGATKYSQIDVSDEDVALYGNDLAIAHGVADVKLTMDGQDASGKYHFSRTWLKRNGKWQAIWFQSTKVQ